jgi:methanethiol S-methyltransferase
MKRILAFLFGIVAYVVFLGSFLYALGFVEGLYVPKTIDSGPVGPVGEAVLIDLLALTIFAVQHSGMARKPFKQWLTRYMPVAIERSLYVLLASLSLVLLFWLWRPIPTIVWQVTEPTLAGGLVALSMLGWFLVLISTFLISHFELFGLSQVMQNLMKRELAPAQFRTPALYKIVRHPIYLGFIIAIWATPVMTVGHLLFAVGTAGYILLGIALEERDLVAQFGDDYRRYRHRVAMLVPFVGAGNPAEPPLKRPAVETKPM